MSKKNFFKDGEYEVQKLHMALTGKQKKKKKTKHLPQTTVLAFWCGHISVRTGLQTLHRITPPLKKQDNGEHLSPPF